MKRVRTSLFLVAVLGVLALCGAALADVIGLEMVGPGEVAENFSASYKAIAYYDNTNTSDVTNLAVWSVEPNMAANIDGNGILTTKDVVTHQAATILASYTEEDVTVEAEKAIDILAICPTGTSLQFDGVDDYVDMADTVKNYLDTNYTVSAWIKAKTIPGVHSIVAYRRSTYDIGYQTLLHLQHNNSDVQFIVGSLGNNAIASYPDALTTNTWYHIVGIREGNVLNVYVNGVSGIPDSETFGEISPDNFKIGAIHCCGQVIQSFFDGCIDEVAIWNRALSAEEIRANMHRRLAGDEPGLVGYWDFDEGEGQIVYDLSGNGNDGQLGSTPDADSSDPAWVESDAPIGICSLYQSATMAVDRAVECKKALIEELLATLAQEWAAYEVLEELLESGDYGDLDKGSIVKAKQKIHSAIQHQEQAIEALEKSIEKLKDALSALGYELEPPP